MERIFNYNIDIDIKSIKISHFLRNQGYSLQTIARLKRMEGSILVNGCSRHMNERLTSGDCLTVHIRETQVSGNILPVPLPLNIIYEDEDLLIVNKPAGMPTHPSAGNHDNSLANGLAWYFKQQHIPFVFRCNNRLDRDTSGITIIAKHMLSASLLSAMILRHEVCREYLAIVRGYDLPDSGTIDAPLSRKPGSIIERIVDKDHGERAVTHYRVVKKENGHSLVSLKLETGRTHQIRIHLKHLGFPLIGDYLYNPDMEYIRRQALHSFRVTFNHPVTGEFMDFQAPLPKDMADIIGFHCASSV